MSVESKYRLRPYQITAVRESIAHLDRHRSTLLTMATGLGKTICLAQIVKEFLANRQDTAIPLGGSPGAVIIAHRQELLRQLKDAAVFSGIENVGIEAAENWADYDRSEPWVVIASVQTLRNFYRHQRFDPRLVSLVVVDETHHIPAQSYQKILKYFCYAKVLGLTATPDRMDKVALGFDSVCFRYAIRDGIQDGWLVPIFQHYVRVHGLDYRKIKSSHGDFTDTALAAVMEQEENLQAVARATLEERGGRSTVVFCASVQQAKLLCDIINRHMPTVAACLHGKTPQEERESILAKFRDGELGVICNCQILTEGWDEVRVSCIVMARPTKSRALYEQMLGRGTRTCEECRGRPVEMFRFCWRCGNKRDLLVLDFVGVSGQHRLMSAIDVLSGPSTPKKVSINLKRRAESRPMDVIAEMNAEAVLQAEAEHEVRRRVIAEVRYSKELRDPFQEGLVVGSKGDHVHEKDYPSLKQIAFLKRQGYNVSGMSRKKAGVLIGKLMSRWRK